MNFGNSVPKERWRNGLEGNLQNARADFQEGDENLLIGILALVYGLLEDENTLGYVPGWSPEGILSTPTLFLLTTVQQKQQQQKKVEAIKATRILFLSPIKE